MNNSKSGEMSKLDWKKWREDTLYFFLSVLVIYLSSFAGILSLPNHKFSFMDLIPNLLTWGAILNYIINVIQNFIRKRNSGERVI